MWTYKNLTIRYKLTLTMMLTCVISLVLAGVLFVMAGYRFSRQNAVNNLTTQAKMMAESCQAPALFNLPDDAAESLKVLRSEPSIVYADVHTKANADFASYYKSDAYKKNPPPHTHGKINGYEFTEGFLVVFQSILNEGEILGTVVLCSDLKPLKSMLRRSIFMVLAIVTGISVVAWILSSRFQRVISKPLLDLTDVARMITRDKEYSVCAVKTSDDEIGVLIDSFNEMLEQINVHKQQLMKMNEELEGRVRQRTAALTQEVAQHKQTTETLKHERNFSRSIIETAQVIMLVLDAEGKIVSFNPYMEQICGYALDEVKGCDWFETFVPERDHAHIRKLFNDAIHDIQTQAEVNAIVTKEKREIQIEWYDKTLKDSDGKLAGLLSIGQDITQRVQREEELKKIQQELMDASRQAGMAEVATDVLHNVGNVLNSINVSTTLISDILEKSEVPNLKKVADMIESHQEDLSRFLTEDAKGRYVPSYLIKVASRLTGEQKEIVDKARTLVADVEHIKSIVKMQQGYAKVSNLETTTKMELLIEDAIRINQSSLSRSHIQVRREYADIGEVTVDKQRVIQILVNLIRNAKAALVESGRVDKILSIRTFIQDQQRLKIEVSDNGAGILQENLTKIFRHGFTTKQDGHGFGLHSGALAAKEMNGSLSVHSDGPGHGATFTLELPFKSAGVLI